MNITSQLDSFERNHKPPIIVNLKRGSSIESVHRVHAVVSDKKGRILMKAGNSDYETFIRSALKPFQAVPFLSSGTAEKISTLDKGIAIACASHSGLKEHSREAFKILWNSNIDVNSLKCPLPTGKSSRLEHNCSGKHAAFLATCKKMNWPLQTYLENNHPLQLEICRLTAELLNIPQEEIVSEKDDCGAPTFRLQLCQIALLYANLSSSENAELEQISRAMIAHPQIISGPGNFDTEIMKRAHGQLLSKSGAEGIQCLSRNGEGIGIAIKVEDGSKRAKQAVALHILKQLEWLTPIAIDEMEAMILKLGINAELEVRGQLQFKEI